MPKREQQELSEQAIERITRVVRSLADDRVERGIELSRPMHCDSCDQDKPAAGSSQYGRFSLCNDCLLDFTLALASGAVDTVDGFMTRRPEGQSPTAADFNTRPEVQEAISRTALPGRDKLLPHNEPC